MLTTKTLPLSTSADWPIAGVGTERVFELGISEARERGLDRPVDAAAFFLGVLRGDRRLVLDRALEPPRIEACVAIAVGGTHLELEERVAGRRDRGLAERARRKRSCRAP